MSLTAFFISLGVGQLLYGPVSDMVGRKPPLYFGLGLFALASIGCALATDIQTLIALRFVQGLAPRPAWRFRARWCATCTPATMPRG